MPKLFEFLGIIVKFWSDDHFPIHVHAMYHDSEMKIELYLKNDKVVRIKYIQIKDAKPFPPAKLKQLKKLVEAEKDTIVQSWIDYFVKNKRFKVRKINAKSIQ